MKYEDSKEDIKIKINVFPVVKAKVKTKQVKIHVIVVYQEHILVLKVYRLVYDVHLAKQLIVETITQNVSCVTLVNLPLILVV